MFPIAVIGANSMTGSRFCDMAQSKYQLIKTEISGSIPLDITNKKDVDIFFETQNFEYAIVFSAFTDVDAAELQRNNKEGSCWQINVNGIENITNAAEKNKKRLIVFSTDFVFDGSCGPYSEVDPIGPNLEKVSWYGITKIKSEKIVLSANNKNIILRISYPYRADYQPKEDFARGILRKFREKKLHKMFSDQTISPTFIDDIYPAIHLIISKNLKGIFHIASPEITTPFDFAKQLIDYSGGNTNEIQKGSLAEFLKQPKSTPRPVLGGMKVDKIISLGFTPTSYKVGLKTFIKQIAHI